MLVLMATAKMKKMLDTGNANHEGVLGPNTSERARNHASIVTRGIR